MSMMARPTKIPGIYPAMNKAATDAVPPLARAKIIRTLLGGINRPVVEELMFTAALNSRGYPSFSILSVKVLPMADAAAMAEPEIAPKSIAEITLT